MAIWCVAGAPLAGGAGWRIWYSAPQGPTFAPSPVKVVQSDQTVATTQTWTPVQSPAGILRQMGVLSVELRTPAPGRMFDVTIPELNRTAPLVWQAMPAGVGSQGVSLILSSCFWRNADKEGAYRAAVEEVLKLDSSPRPAFKLLVGDQLYLDWPSRFLPNSANAITAERYQEYWGDDAYRDVLTATPNFFVCDDHEFWNDYPERQIHLERTWTVSSRKDYRDAAESHFKTFQAVNNGMPQRWFQFDIRPVSFFLTDTRSERTRIQDNPPHFMGDAQWAALTAWQQNLRGPGILVLGQPLYQKDGDFRDHSLSNFEGDYRRLTGLIVDSLDGRNVQGRPHDILILSGDIHTGRHVRAWVPARDPARPGRHVHELIASPASRVLTASLVESEPEPERPPSSIPPTPRVGEARWTIDEDQDVLFETVQNNLGVLRLFPVVGDPDSVRVEFRVYFVRAANKPFWKRNPFSSESSKFLLYDSTTEINVLQLR